MSLFHCRWNFGYASTCSCADEIGMSGDDQVDTARIAKKMSITFRFSLGQKQRFDQAKKGRPALVWKLYRRLRWNGAYGRLSGRSSGDPGSVFEEPEQHIVRLCPGHTGQWFPASSSCNSLLSSETVGCLRRKIPLGLSIQRIHPLSRTVFSCHVCL